MESGDEKAQKAPQRRLIHFSLSGDLELTQPLFFDLLPLFSTFFFFFNTPVPAVRRRRLCCLLAPQLDARRRRDRVGAEDANHQGEAFVCVCVTERRGREREREREENFPRRRDLNNKQTPLPHS